MVDMWIVVDDGLIGYDRRVNVWMNTLDRWMMTHGSQGTRVYLYDLFLGLIIDFHPTLTMGGCCHSHWLWIPGFSSKESSLRFCSVLDAGPWRTPVSC